MIRAEVVPPALDGERVDRVVALLTGLARARISELVRDGAVRLRDETVKVRSSKVRSGDTVEVDVPDVAALLERAGLRVTSMGRGPEQDPRFYAYAGAAAAAAVAGAGWIGR